MISLVKILCFLTTFSVQSQYVCNTDPLQQIYPNQNMCVLLGSIPSQLQNLPYGIYPDTDLYNTARFNYNKRFNVFPSAIFTPTTPDEVAFVLASLRANNLPFALRSGGHCYGPGSLSNCCPIIDLRNFNSITPDIENQTVTIGAGAKLGTIIETLGALDFAIPTGTCPSVGIAGLTLGGGLGLLSRAFGATCDNVISITLVTANAQIIEVDQSHYPDLFFALLGAGGGSFGIVLGFTFQMHYLPVVTSLELDWPWNPKGACQVFQAWQSWIRTLPPGIGTEFSFKYVHGQPTFKVTGLKIGSDQFNEWKSAFAQFKPQVTLTTQRYVDAARGFASSYTLPFSKVKSKMLFKPLPAKAISLIAHFFDTIVRNNQNIIVYFEFGAGLGKLAKGTTSYFPRAALMWNFQFIYWRYETQSASSLKMLRAIYKKVAPYTSPYSYANLIDYDLGQDYLVAYYGNLVDQLIAIKRKYDPANIFTWRQSIPLATSNNLSFGLQEKYCGLEQDDTQ